MPLNRPKQRAAPLCGDELSGIRCLSPIEPGRSCLEIFALASRERPSHKLRFRDTLNQLPQCQSCVGCSPLSPILPGDIFDLLGVMLTPTCVGTMLSSNLRRFPKALRERKHPPDLPGATRVVRRQCLKPSTELNVPSIQTSKRAREHRKYYRPASHGRSVLAVFVLSCKSSLAT